jgi:DNA-binding MarR family transcriptional regulator
MDGIDPQQPAHPETSGPGGSLPAEAAWVGERTPHALDERLRTVLSLGVEVRQAFARRLGLGDTDLSAMEHLMAATATGPIGPVELSRRLGITSAAATQLLHRLSAAGHVERRPHPGDRRRQAVLPTGSGMAGIFRQLQPMVTALDAVATDLDDAERATVARYLDRVAAILRDTVDHDPQAPPEGRGVT